MTITYEFEGKLYVNLTNKCSNSCDFCVRTRSDGFYSEGSLWLEHDPDADEASADILSHDLAKYKELVFCGYGEPTEQLDVLLECCRRVRAASGIKIRINTNGQANLIHKRDVTPLFAGLFDIVSVSLNAANAEEYQRVCHSCFGEAAYEGLLDFAQKVKKYVPTVLLSVVRTTIPDEDIEKCRAIADARGVELRVRELV